MKEQPTSISEAPPQRDPSATVSARLEQYEHRQRELWRITLFILLVVSAGFAVVAWPAIRALSHRYEVLAKGLGPVILVVLFVAYVWKRNQEIAELRGLVRGIEQRDAVPPSDRQLDQLFHVISRSQQGFRDLIDSFSDVLLALGLDGEIRAVNRSFADMLGIPFQDIIGRKLTDFIEEGSDDGAELLRRNMPRFLDRRTWSGIVQIRLKRQNTVFYFDCTAHAMTRENAVHGLTVLARDITALRKNEARFTELFETLQEGIYIVTPEDHILDVNPALVRMLGYDSKDELLARRVSEIFPDETVRAMVRQEVDRHPVLEGREITLHRKDGSPVICLNTAAAVRDNAGRVVRYQGALMDITVRREMERRLYKEQELARRLVDSFPDLILVLDSSQRYTFVSPRIIEVLGYTVEEEMQLGFGASAHPEDVPALKSLFSDILGGAQTFGSIEVRVRHKRGDWRRLRAHFSPLLNETGKTEGVVISARDMTDLKRLEEQLIQAEKLAAMGQMLAGVAHELNNPLTAILGVSELLSENGAFAEAPKRQLDLVHRQARRAARIVQNLLEFSRPASPQKKSVDLNNIIERTVQLHEHSLRRNNIAIDFHPQPDFPQVVADANQLIQVFLNLITNAEHAIREVRDTGRIQIRLARTSTRVAVIVQDDGVGLRPEALPRIFDPFYTTKRPGGGTGLGLSICLSIVQEHHGSIDAEPLPGGGSAFTVYLPAASLDLPLLPQAAVPALAQRPVAGNKPDAEWEFLQGRSILVLDDEESIRSLLEEGLSGYGLVVFSAATVAEALAHCAKRPMDLLLCDVHLLEGGAAVNGKDAARRILQSTQRKPAVIFMTGDLTEGNNSPELQGAGQIQKPFRLAEVLQLAKELLRSTPASVR